MTTAADSGPPPPAELAEQLRTAIQHLLPVLRDRSTQRDLTPSRRAALATLTAHGPLRISDLATRMGIALSTTSRMVDVLDEHGWIDRNPDPRDQRASLIAVNDAGRLLLDTMRRETTSRLTELITRLPAAQQRSLHAAVPALEALSERSEDPS
ncbi:MarR family winged helix-turn-helix transcriptional regulator [Streptomyces sp. NPDC051569]|uniref:MarR family winged helix-turn-helix transcriptional regulator n=1 Tax=Streptomyces sp. NPDC051569 TaxID=3365661 RepID=UPI0037B74A80